MVLLLVAWTLGAAELRAADPVVSNVRASQRAGDKLVDILYDVADADGDALTITVAVSTNGGIAFDVPAAHFSGPGFGSGVSPGVNKLVVWDARADWNGQFATNVCFQVTASDAPAPPGMALVSSSAFAMGDSFNEGMSDEQPVHSVYVSAFYMDRLEVTKALWDEVYGWATNHGYAFDNPGCWYDGVNYGKGSSHPVHTLNWYDVVKWCNARSEKAERVPAYYTDAARTTIYRRGRVNVQNDWVNWNAGYRLPTEAEWEKAARGGSGGHRFPWSNVDTISHAQANYYSSWSAGHPAYAYDVNTNSGYHPLFNDTVYPYTSPAGNFAANEFGLYDLAGNVWEWCWDWYGSYTGAEQVDPRGPAVDGYRVLRGGGWGNGANRCRVTYRNSAGADSGGNSTGFRTVLPPG